MKQGHIRTLLRKISRGRPLDRGDAAACVAWLIAAANPFATGAVFDLSGERATY